MKDFNYSDLIYSSLCTVMSVATVKLLVPLNKSDEIILIVGFGALFGGVMLFNEWLASKKKPSTDISFSYEEVD